MATIMVMDYRGLLRRISHAGLGIAMGNVPEEVKQAAARVTASNDEEGVYIALKALGYTATDTGAKPDFSLQ